MDKKREKETRIMVSIKSQVLFQKIHFVRKLFFYISSYAILLIQLSSFHTHLLSETATNNKPLILVSVPPYIDIVQNLVGSSAHVQSIVSGSTSSHTYEPTPKTILTFQNAYMWFGIGEPFENKMLHALQNSLNSKVIYINLRQEIAKYIQEYIALYPGLADHHGCGSSHVHHKHTGTMACDHKREEKIHSNSQHDELVGIDPHIWMSPSLLSHQIDAISSHLRQSFAQYIDIDKLQTQQQDAIQRCLDLQKRANEKLTPHMNKSILVSHAAYSYLLKPFYIHQYSIEEEGKEPSPQTLTKLIMQAQKEHITTIFTQSQYPSKGAEVIIEHVLKIKHDYADSNSRKGGSPPQIIELDPYNNHYFDAMTHIIDAIEQAVATQYTRTSAQ